MSREGVRCLGFAGEEQHNNACTIHVQLYHITKAKFPCILMVSYRIADVQSRWYQVLYAN